MLHSKPFQPWEDSDPELILSFGRTALADRIVTADQLRLPEITAPLDLVFSPSGSLVHISETVSPEILFGPEYPYFSSVSPSLLQHFRESAEEIIKTRSLGPNSLVVEAASNDGYMLKVFMERGVPVLGVTAVGTDMARDAKYMRLATRMCAELGATYVKTYFVDEGFETVTAACPVPIVIAGGKKMGELDALTMAYRAVDQGAAGVDMGRNIFQSDAPPAMIQAVGNVVHHGMSPKDAFDFYQTLKHEK